MSTIGRDKLAPNEKAFKYEFSLQILKFVCDLPLPCSLRFMWKRNSRSIQTKNTYDGKAGVNELTINQRLSNISTIVYNTDTRTFSSKQCELVVNMYFNGVPKKLASCYLDLKNVLDGKDYKTNRAEVFETGLNMYINKNTKECKLTYKLTCMFKEEVMQSEKSLGGTALNTSGYSMQQDKFYQKKYDIPSKDNHSVTSYNTGRYPSASKRESNDASSIRKFDYGYLTGLKSHISNQANNKDFDVQSGLKSIDNKTEMNEANFSNRQLIDQQNKRAKAQADLARNRVEIDQLKKKINQLTIDNLKIKDELKNASNAKQSASKEQINELQFKVYELNNQIRDVRNQLDARKRQAERLDSQCSRLRSQKNASEAELMSRQRKIQEYQKNAVNSKMLEAAQDENNQLKYQLDSARRYVEEMKKQFADQEAQIRTQKYRQGQELKNQIEFLRKQNEQIKARTDSAQEQQKKMIQYEQKLKTKTTQLYSKNKVIQDLEDELDLYKNKISQYQSEKTFMQRQLIRLKQENGSRNGQFQRGRQQLQSKADWLSGENNRMTQQIRYLQQQLQESQQNTQRIKQEQGQSEGRSAKLLPQINQLQKKVNQYESQLTGLRTQANQFKRQKQALEGQLEQMRQNMFKSVASTTTNPQMDRMFRQTLQMQVDLKFANDQLQRLRGLEEAYENQKWRAQKEHNDRVELQRQCERIEKELVNKNRAYMIEVEKTKMFNQQKNQNLATISFYKEELQKNRNIIFNLEQQMNDLNALNNNRQQEYTRLEEENNQLRAEKTRLSANREEVRGLQEKVKQLEAKYNEKKQNLDSLNYSLGQAHKQGKEMQIRNEQLHRQLINRDKNQYDLESRCRQLQKQKAVWQGDIGRLSQQKRTLEKRNDMIMEEIHGMKKRFEEEKGRSMSFTRNEDFNKVRTLESELEKKEKNISKLNKEKLQLQEQNVKINVQVMKLLSELEKLKAGSPTFSTQSSYKHLGTHK